MTSSSTSHPYWPTEIMVDRQLTETTHELVKAKDSLEQKDSLIQQLKDQINQMDSEIQELQTTIAGRLPRGEYSHSTDLDRDDQGTWYL
jgi:peptidoglycan hydrolase CwlO-like protein